MRTHCAWERRNPVLMPARGRRKPRMFTAVLRFYTSTIEIHRSGISSSGGQPSEACYTVTLLHCYD